MVHADSGAKEFWLEAVRSEGRAFRAAVGALELATPVPSCPEWTVAHLVGHLGRVYEWVNLVVQAGGDKAVRPEHRSEDAAIVAWFDEQYTRLLATLEAADAEAPAWNWATQPPVAGFWPRRMAHETAVHRWDAQFARGTADPIEPELAADGVSEVLDTFLPAGKATAADAGEGVVRLTATDVKRTWLVRLRPGGVLLLDESAVLDDSAEAQTGVAGAASDLLLALWGRQTPSALSFEGHPARFEALRTG